MWECKKCHFTNDDNAPNCSRCNHVKPSRSLRRSASLAVRKTVGKVITKGFADKFTSKSCLSETQKTPESESEYKYGPAEEDFQLKPKSKFSLRKRSSKYNKTGTDSTEILYQRSSLPGQSVSQNKVPDLQSIGLFTWSFNNTCDLSSSSSTFVKFTIAKEGSTDSKVKQRLSCPPISLSENSEKKGHKKTPGGSQDKSESNESKTTTKDSQREPHDSDENDLIVGGPLFVVAIDFGTTYSGYAFSTKNDFMTDPCKVWANQTWHAGAHGLLSKKTPTCLLLNPKKEFHAFGYEAEEEYASLTFKNEHHSWYYFRRFKMKLHGEELIEDGKVIEDETGKTYSALEVFSKSIAYLKDSFENELDNRGLDIKSSEIRWVLTVPAIWNDSAKRFMRKAAMKAGIDNKQLLIALEPEAASFFCQHEKTERGELTGFSASGPGTKYMVADLGGGTVDISVHEKLSNGNLKEIHVASGGDWGGTVVDESYIQLLIRIFGGPTIHQFREESMYDYIGMMREFEVTKRSVTSRKKSEICLRIPENLSNICKNLNGESIDEIVNGPNFPFKNKIYVAGEKYIVIELETVKDVFAKALGQIVQHIEHILLHELVKDISMIVLVGGFSESPFVQEAIKSTFKNDNRRVIIPQEPSLAVVRGAVIFGHRPNLIQSRIIRYTYGTAPSRIYNPNVDPVERRYFLHGEERVKIFRPFIKKGSTAALGYTIPDSFYFKTLQKNSVFSVYVSSNPDAMYPDDNGCRRLKEVPVGKLLPPLSKEDREISIDYIFGNTEIEIVVTEKETGYTYNDKFDLEEE